MRGDYPGAAWHPYSAESPFNRPVPTNPPFVANSAEIVNRVLTTFDSHISNMNVGSPRSEDYEHPTYWSEDTDPLFTIHCTRPWGSCSVEGLHVRIPQAALAPPTTNDGHMTVIEQWSGWEYDFYEAPTPLPSGGGTINIGWGGRTAINGNGLGTGDAVAAEWGNLAGIMRAQEVVSGTIGHALFLVLKCDAGSFVYPATKAGGACSDRTNAPPMGTHLWLDLPATEIDSLGIPAWQKEILHALHRYGAYMGDTGGPGFALQFESPLTYSSFGRIDPLVPWAQANGWSLYNGSYVGHWQNVPSSVWQHLHVLDSCVARGSC
jgi:hypothetical protein